MKRVVFLALGVLLVLSSVLSGCCKLPTIIIGIAGPMNDIQGKHMLAGAQIAATQINIAGGVKHGGNCSSIRIVSRNTNEIADPANAWQAVDYLINTANAEFIIGGVRTEAVEPMIQGVFKTADPSVPFFICGAATPELLSGGLSGPSAYPGGYGTPYAYGYSASSDFYKYIFRATPFNNSGFLLGMVMPMFAQISQQIQTAMGWTWNGTAFPCKVNVAIFGENLAWALPIIAGYQALVGGYGPYFGWKLTTVQTCSDDPPVSVVDAALTDIENAHCQVILTCMSGPVGETFGKRMGALNISAIPVGINKEAHATDYWINTAGGARYEVTTGAWALGVNNTAETAGFIARYMNTTIAGLFPSGTFPIYTAASYDMVYALKEAIEATDSLSKDVVCSYILTHSRVSTSGNAQYYPVWDQNTHALDKYGRDLPALNDAQVDAIYSGIGYIASPAWNYTMAPFTTNDLVFGPGYVTGIGVQWVSGTQVGVWPKAGYDVVVNADVPIKVQTTLTRAICGLNWSNDLEYPGTQDAVIPADFQNQWAIWCP